MANILETLGGMISPELMGTIGNQLNESPSGVESALGGLIPSILGGMVQKAEGGNFGGIFDMIKGADNFELSDLVGMMGSGNLAHNDPRDAGGGLLGSLLGNKTGGLIDAISGMAGINKKSSSSLLGMAAPFIMSFLAKKIKGDKMDAGGLASMLLGQKGSIMAAIPSVLSAVLGFGNTEPTVATRAESTVRGAAASATSAASSAASATANTATAAASSGMSFLKWLLPLLIIGAIAWFGLRSCDTSGIEAGMENVGDSMSDVAGKAGDAAGGLVDGAVEGAGDLVDGAAAMGSDALSSLKETADGLWGLTLPGGVEIEANKEGVEYSLIDFITSDKAVDNTSWFNFDALRFATGSSSLDADFSKRQIENMVAVLKAYPDVHLKIGGYTDNVGNPASNMKLSQKRADNVMTTLIDKGIDASRLSAEGFGEQHPACPANDTPECKAQNRRIAARVTQK